MYTPTDRLARGSWGVDNLASAPSELWMLAAVRAARGACQPIPNSQLARQAIGRHILFAVVGRASTRIWLSLRINISLTIYKMVEDFSTQFSPLYLPMKYLAIISRHLVHTHTHTHTHARARARARTHARTHARTYVHTYICGSFDKFSKFP